MTCGAGRVKAVVEKTVTGIIGQRQIGRRWLGGLGRVVIVQVLFVIGEVEIIIVFPIIIRDVVFYREFRLAQYN